MDADLAAQIRKLIDATPPVSVNEAVSRARARQEGTVARTRPSRLRPGHRPAGSIAVLAASTLVALAAGLIWSVASATEPRAPQTASPSHVRIVLTAARVRTIVARSSSATSSGTAQVTETTSRNGTPQSNNSVAVTFDGANIDEKITVNAEPPGSAASFTTDDRLVDGQFYIYTAGPDDVTEWMHDTNSADDVASMQFPDPRNLYTALDASATFQIVGTSTVSGSTLTHLVALDPAAIPTGPLGNLAQGTLTSFEMWIDPSDVVQQMAFSSSDTARGCLFDFSSAEMQALHAELEKEGLLGSGGRVGLPALHAAAQAAGITPTCGPQTTTSQVTVAFSDLGAPETIVAPTGAVPFAGKG